MRHLINRQRILVACEESGRVRSALRRRGFDAWSCDLLPAGDGDEHHIHGDVFDVLGDGWAGETGASSMKIYKMAGWKPKEGFQLRYIYFLDPAFRERLIIPVLPFSEIERRGAGMYKGQKRVRSADSGTGIPIPGGGASPTRTLQSTLRTPRSSSRKVLKISIRKESPS